MFFEPKIGPYHEKHLKKRVRARVLAKCVLDGYDDRGATVPSQGRRANNPKRMGPPSHHASDGTPTYSRDNIDARSTERQW